MLNIGLKIYKPEGNLFPFHQYYHREGFFYVYINFSNRKVSSNNYYKLLCSLKFVPAEITYFTCDHHSIMVHCCISSAQCSCGVCMG